MQTLWKSFKADFKNEHGNIKWEIGKWQHQHHFSLNSRWNRNS